MRKHGRNTARTNQGKDEIAEEIIRHLMRRHSTAAVLLHHALAELLGVGPTDLQCLDLVRERGALTGSNLAAITGLTTGAITGVVARLERAGYLERESDPDDKRRQILRSSLERTPDVRKIFEPLHKELALLLEEFDDKELGAIAGFLTRSRELAYRHMALIRSLALSGTDKPQTYHAVNAPNHH
jgi:DNA-binding MarR family transcriptional regulator